MVSNILLVAILGTIIGVFLILNDKINDLLKYCSKSFDILSAETKNIQYVLKTFDKLIDKFDKLVIVEKGYLNVFRDECEHLNDNIIHLKQNVNVMDTDIKFLIISEHRHTRNEMTKKAKISSKFNSKRKTNKSINK